MKKGKSTHGSSSSSTTTQWSKLHSILLVGIFNRLTLSDLLLGASQACQDWRMAAAKSRFFLPAGTKLDLRFIDKLPPKETNNYIKLLRIALNTENTSTNFDHVQFPDKVLLPEDIVVAIAQRSTSLRSLRLSYISIHSFSSSLLSKLLSFWKNITSFEAAGSKDPALACIQLLGLHCNNLTHFGLDGTIEKPQAEAIVSNLPEIESLDLNDSFISESALDTILGGLKKLKKVNLRHVLCGNDDDMDYLQPRILRGRGAKILKPEVMEKLESLEEFLYCGGQTCGTCTWFYQNEDGDEDSGLF